MEMQSLGQFIRKMLRCGWIDGRIDGWNISCLYFRNDNQKAACNRQISVPSSEPVITRCNRVLFWSLSLVAQVQLPHLWLADPRMQISLSLSLSLFQCRFISPIRRFPLSQHNGISFSVNYCLRDMGRPFHADNNIIENEIAAASSHIIFQKNVYFYRQPISRSQLWFISRQKFFFSSKTFRPMLP